jgi:CDP-diacylglycerol--serine O-phosphatidyltransferase
VSAQRENRRLLRFLAPNAMTAASMMFGLASMMFAHEGEWALSGWMIIYAVMTDRLDGLVARAMKATSSLGVQLDSFADFLNFGVAPAFLFYSFLRWHPNLPFTDGWPRLLLLASCGLYVLGAVFRLARYNITSDDEVPTEIFFGIPTTLAGGLAVIWFLVLLKYDPAVATFGGPKIYGSSWQTIDEVWTYAPIALLLSAYLMVSSLPMPKVGTTKRLSSTIFIMANLVVGYILGFMRYLPEICAWQPTIWIVMFLIWGQVSPSARNLKQPRLFPEADDGRVKMRPQEDMAPDDE